MNSRIILISVASILAFFAIVSSRAYAESSIDPVWKKIDEIIGKEGKDQPGEVHKYGWPRTDLKVRIGDVRIEPALALGSWAAFQKKGDSDQARVMGDLVLTEPELNPVITELQSNGLKVMAVHNHLVHESPKVIYVHFLGEGEAASLGKSLKDALGKTKTPMQSAAKKPAKISPSEQETFKKIQAILGHNGTMAGRVLQVGVPRVEQIEQNGMEVPASMGTGIAMNFQTEGSRVATTGDFVLIADEVNPVIQELRAHGIEVTALHSHMLSESPRLFFLHFWGADTSEKISEGLKAALSKVKTK
jgi:biotin operon repressor